MSINFKIVVPVYNAEAWIETCVRSIAAQVYKNFECIIINDASTDNTGEILKQIPYIQDDPRFHIQHNDQNVKALQNIVDGFNALGAKGDPESVLMVVDGDDRFFSEYSLALVSQAYEQTKCSLTYGNHIHYPDGASSNCEPIPQWVQEKNAFRLHKFVTSHLRTFKSKLWYNIKDEDLRDDDGTYYGVAWDVAFMMPMLEMARGKILFIPNVLYVYNRINPLSDDAIRQDDQHRIEMIVRSKPKYDFIVE